MDEAVDLGVGDQVAGAVPRHGGCARLDLVGEAAQADAVADALALRSDALRVDLRREELGERRGAGLDPRLRLAEPDVGLADQPHRRQDVPLVLHLLARDAERHAEPDPELDAALAFPRAIVVDDPLDPFATHGGVGTIGKDRGILPGHDPLVGEPWGYRRKGRLSVKWVEKKGKVLVGFREDNPRFVADLSVCYTLLPEIGQRIATEAATRSARSRASVRPASAKPRTRR